MFDFISLAQVAFVVILTFSATNGKSAKENKADKNNCGSLSVGIIGAGIGGLYAALLLQSIGVDYEVIEAKPRAGGRIYTYHFEKVESNEVCNKQAYFDTGAMRFPSSALFDKLVGKDNCTLIAYLNKNVNDSRKINVVPYIYQNKNDVYYFNGIHRFRSDIENQDNGPGNDLFNMGLSKNGTLPDNYAKRSGIFWDNKVTEPFTKMLETGSLRRLRELQKFDHYSYREYAIERLNYPPQVVEYAEGQAFGYGLYRYGLTEVIRNYFPDKLSGTKFHCIDGGSSKIVEAIVSLLKKDILYSEPVIKITPVESGALKVQTTKTIRKYEHVILTPTLYALSRIDLKDCKISYGKRQAMKVLKYMEFIKVGLLFSQRWWQDNEIMNGRPIYGGQSSCDLPIGTVIFPSQGLNCTKYPGVVISSYTSADNAERLATMSDEEITELSLDNLEEMFKVKVRDYYTNRSYVYRWKADEYTGGFMFLDSSHFNSYIHSISMDEANGRIHIGGETPGTYHGWVDDSITSTFWAVWKILRLENRQNEMKKLTQIWGKFRPPYVDIDS